jgi:hypothetical protein
MFYLSVAAHTKMAVADNRKATAGQFALLRNILAHQPRFEPNGALPHISSIYSYTLATLVYHTFSIALLPCCLIFLLLPVVRRPIGCCSIHERWHLIP